MTEFEITPVELINKLTKFNFEKKIIDDDNNYVIYYNGLIFRDFQDFADSAIRFILKNPETFISKSECKKLHYLFKKRKYGFFMDKWSKTLRHPLVTNSDNQNIPFNCNKGLGIEIDFLEEHQIALDSIISILPDTQEISTEIIRTNLTAYQFTFIFFMLNNLNGSIFANSKNNFGKLSRMITSNFITDGKNNGKLLNPKGINNILTGYKAFFEGKNPNNTEEHKHALKYWEPYLEKILKTLKSIKH